jgi:hypothetical protein
MLVSIEDNQDWFEKIKDRLPDNVRYNLITDKAEYAKAIARYQNLFDVIIIDGSHRYECASHALTRLRDDGLIILDNSDRMDRTSELLRAADLIEADMSGFGPINGYTWTTSFYFRRSVILKSAHSRQPLSGTGALESY